MNRLLSLLVVLGVLTSAVASIKLRSESKFTYDSSLRGGETLRAGDVIRSPSSQYYAVLQSDGNLVVNKGANILPSGRVAIQPSQRGGAPYKLVMQTDGNLVLYDRNENVMWFSDTYLAGFSLNMRDDGNLVLYDRIYRALWKNEYDLGRFLRKGETLQQNQTLISPNSKYYAIVQDDGNFVVYESENFIPSNERFSTRTKDRGNRPFRLVLQKDGELVLYEARYSIWFSGSDYRGDYLAMQDDGNLVLYTDDHKLIWESKHDIRAPIKSSLKENENLDAGLYLRSLNHKYYAILQRDGNFVVYESEEFTQQNARFATGTSDQGKGPYQLRMQADGNLVLYDSIGDSLWASHTNKKGNGGYHLDMQNDGNLVLYDRYNTPLWASKNSN